MLTVNQARADALLTEYPVAGAEPYINEKEHIVLVQGSRYLVLVGEPISGPLKGEAIIIAVNNLCPADFSIHELTDLYAALPQD